jgi:hypothetical protein
MTDAPDTDPALVELYRAHGPVVKQDPATGDTIVGASDSTITRRITAADLEGFSLQTLVRKKHEEILREIGGL